MLLNGHGIHDHYPCHHHDLRKAAHDKLSYSAIEGRSLTQLCCRYERSDLHQCLQLGHLLKSSTAYYRLQKLPNLPQRRYRYWGSWGFHVAYSFCPWSSTWKVRCWIGVTLSWSSILVRQSIWHLHSSWALSECKGGSLLNWPCFLCQRQRHLCLTALGSAHYSCGLKIVSERFDGESAQCFGASLALQAFAERKKLVRSRHC